MTCCSSCVRRIVTFAGLLVIVPAARAVGEEPRAVAEPAAAEGSPEQKAAIESRLQQIKNTFPLRLELVKQEHDLRAKLDPIERKIGDKQRELNSVASEIQSLEREQLENEQERQRERQRQKDKDGKGKAENEHRQPIQRIDNTAKINSLRNQAGDLTQQISGLKQEAAVFAPEVNKLNQNAGALKAQWWALTDAQMALTRREQQAAIAPLTEWIAAHEQDATARLTRGFAFWKLGDLEQALVDFDAAVKSAGPLMSIALMARGGLLCAMGNQKGGMADFIKVSKTNKKDPLLLLFRGQAHLAAGNFQQATSDFRAAAKLDPNNAQVYGSWALLFAACPESRFRSGKRGVEFATKACELTDGRQWQALAALAAAHAENGDFDEAVKQITQAAELSYDENRELCLAQKKKYKNQQPLRLAETHPMTVAELSADGVINWPPLLAAESYQAQRTALDTIFARRAKVGTALEGADLRQAEQKCAELMRELKKHIGDAKASEWIAAESFAHKLIGEARLAPIKRS
jgi:tetratricopeptide (TPR) repeat protein